MIEIGNEAATGQFPALIPTDTASRIDHLSLRIYRGREQLLALTKAWHELSQRCASHYLHLPEWYLAKIDHQGEGRDDVAFFAYYHGRTLAAVFPFKPASSSIEWFGLPVRLPAWTLYCPDDMSVCDASVDPRFRDRSLIRRLIADARRESRFWQLLHLRHLPATGHMLPLLEGSIFGPFVRRTHASKYIATHRDYDAIMSGYDARFKRNLRRKQKKLASLGGVRYRFLRDSASCIPAYERFLDVEAAGWKGKSGSALREQPRQQALYRRLLERLAPNGHFGVHLLELDGRAIAGQLAIYAGRSIYLLKIGYDETFKHVSPGFQLVNALLQHACERSDIDRVSFVTGPSWADIWKPTAEPVYCGYCFRSPLLNLLGRLANRSRHPVVEASA